MQCNTIISSNIEYEQICSKLSHTIPLGEQLKYYRQLKGLEQTQLAEMLGVSRDTIIDIENKEMKKPNLELLNRLFEVLEIKDKVKLPDYIKFLMDKPEKIIRQFQKKNKLSQNKLAKLIGVDRSNLRKWLNGQAQISMKCYNKLKDVIKF